jgi:hypothetical protein
MNGRVISTREAAISTMTASVQTLTITKKQVTMAVFRQLYCEPLVDAVTCGLNGTPWGRVNYFWGDCKDDHLHVVWQKGDELRRACCWRERLSDKTMRESNALRAATEREWDEWAQAALLGTHEDIFCSPGLPDWLKDHHEAIRKDFEYVCGNPDEARRVIAYPGDQRNVRLYGIWKEKVRDMIACEKAEFGRSLLGVRIEDRISHLHVVARRLMTPISLLRDEILGVIHDNDPQEHDKLEELWAKRWQELCDLPQLFIAV